MPSTPTTPIKTAGTVELANKQKEIINQVTIAEFIKRAYPESPYDSFPGGKEAYDAAIKQSKERVPSIAETLTAADLVTPKNTSTKVTTSSNRFTFEFARTVTNYDLVEAARRCGASSSFNKPGL
ncbi:MAG: hypothetical protein NTU49_11215 [Gammaproteobacteria bacterium]|nr:hypothetical protein [Gammaproteobacteria bacterium]